MLAEKEGSFKRILHTLFSFVTAVLLGSILYFDSVLTQRNITTLQTPPVNQELIMTKMT
jgi:hypothetical protein